MVMAVPMAMAVPVAMAVLVVMAVLGVSLVAMGESLGGDMVTRSFYHMMQYADPNVKRAVPLGLALLAVSNADNVLRARRLFVWCFGSREEY